MMLELEMNIRRSDGSLFCGQNVLTYHKYVEYCERKMKKDNSICIVDDVAAL